MYSIVNTSGRHLSFQDLRIVLSPRERIDLDSVCERRDIESSIHLRNALRKGHIKLVIKDKSSIGLLPETKVEGSITKQDLNKIKDDIAVMIKDALSSIIVSGISSSRESASLEVAQKFDMPDVVLEEIHKKAVNRLICGLENSVDVKASKSNSIDIKNNLDELEDLL
jgi:hypothetical protein